MAPKVSLEYKENTRDRILNAAQRLFEQKGYYETSMDDIVKESGLSKGAIYGYFESKEDLFESLQAGEYNRTLEQANALLSGEGSARSKLEKIADIYFLSQDESSRKQCRMTLEFSATSLRMKPVHIKIEDQYTRVHDLLAAIIKEGIRKGEFRKGIDVDSIASLLVATVDGLTLRWATTDAQIDWKRVRDAIVDLTLQGISSSRGK
jgi:AcrR family transcriptional regulator